MVEKCAQFANYTGGIAWNTIPERPIRVTWLVGDGSKIERELGWKPKVGVDEGLRRTVEFWKNRCR